MKPELEQDPTSFSWLPSVYNPRADLEALLGAVLWTQRTNPNLTGAMRARLTEIEGRLMDGITHCHPPSPGSDLRALRGFVVNSHPQVPA
jgi:hypothetical protein